MTRPEALEALLAWILEQWHCGWAMDVDGQDLQDKAIALGLLREVPYDPARHGEEGLVLGVEPGDEWIESVEAP